MSLTPEALTMMDSIARAGSFAAAARDMGKVPSALTYAVRQLEDSLDVLLFDRSSRQAKLTAAGTELLAEGRRLLAELDAVAHRVRRVATGWEAQLTVASDDVISRSTLLDLCEAFYALAAPGAAPPSTRLQLRTEVLAGTWEALTSGVADIAIGVGLHRPAAAGIAVQTLGELPFVFVVASHHALTKLRRPVSDTDMQAQRAVAVADSAQRGNAITVNLLPGQDVLTVASMADKMDALQRGLGCGYLPETWAREALAAKRLVALPTQRPAPVVPLAYAWREQRAGSISGLAMAWWLAQLASNKTRAALLGEAGQGLVNAAKANKANPGHRGKKP